MVKQRSIKQAKGKWDKYVKKVDGKLFWTFDSEREAIIPREEDGMKLIIQYHENQGHRSLGAVYYAMKFEYYWPGIKEGIKKVIKNVKGFRLITV